jgi:hypothetical protein
MVTGVVLASILSFFHLPSHCIPSNHMPILTGGIPPCPGGPWPGGAGGINPPSLTLPPGGAGGMNPPSPTFPPGVGGGGIPGPMGPDPPCPLVVLEKLILAVPPPNNWASSPSRIRMSVYSELDGCAMPRKKWTVRVKRPFSTAGLTYACRTGSR